jgi:hypothetical protein
MNLLLHHQERSLGLFSNLQLMVQKKMRSESIQMRLEVEGEKNLMQQLCTITLKKNLNPTWIR